MINAIAIPSTERQNKWVEDYIVPIFNLNIREAIDNYKANQRAALREDMEQSGVYDSLRKLEEQGTSWDKISGEIIEATKKPLKYDRFSKENILRSMMKSYADDLPGSYHIEQGPSLYDMPRSKRSFGFVEPELMKLWK